MNRPSTFSRFSLPFMALLLWVAAAAAGVCSSCTRNNGDIGPWFGTWHLTRITANDQPLADYDGNIFWNFQNNIVMLSHTLTDQPGDHTVQRRWGTWEETDGALCITFAGYDNLGGPEGAEWKYMPFPILHLPYGSTAPLRIALHKGHRLELVYEATDGVTYRYYLNKQS